jgi:hypothetical protein
MRILLSAALLATTSVLCFAQEKVVTPPTVSPIIVSTTTPGNEAVAAPLLPATATEASLPLSPVPSDPFLAMRIPLNSKIYIAPFKSEDSTKPVEGFETYMAAALRKKGVPVIMIADRSQADFEIAGSADKKGAGFAKKWLLGDFRRSTSASLTVTNLHTGVIAYADASDRASANRGLRSSAEKLAKYLKRKIVDDQKKFVRMGTTVAIG